MKKTVVKASDFSASDLSSLNRTKPVLNKKFKFKFKQSLGNVLDKYYLRSDVSISANKVWGFSNKSVD
jgi:hypothetical protein